MSMRKVAVRLDKYLADMGIGTRSEVKNLVRKGRIKINDEVVKKPEEKITIGEDRVLVDGNRVDYVSYEYYMLNKPAGVISASSDPKAETVIDLIEEAVRKDLFPVGRLDKDTEGLLLITNDGELAHQLLSPKKHVDKVYFAVVLGKVKEEVVELFAKGLQVDEQLTAMPAKLKIGKGIRVAFDEIKEKLTDEEDYWREKGLLTMDSDGTLEATEITLTLREGKFHQVKRMFEAVNHKVVYLKRLSMGSLQLDDTLAPGEYRMLTEVELKELRNDRSCESSHF